MGCSPNPVDRFKRTPLEDAMRSDHGDVAALIAQKGGRWLACALPCCASGRFADFAWRCRLCAVHPSYGRPSHAALCSMCSMCVCPCGACPNLNAGYRGFNTGGKVMSKHGELIDLAESPLSLNVRIFGEYDPEWEIDMNSLKIMDKIGEGEFGTVFKAKWQGTLVAVKVRDAWPLLLLRRAIGLLHRATIMPRLALVRDAPCTLHPGCCTLRVAARIAPKRATVRGVLPQPVLLLLLLPSLPAAPQIRAVCPLTLRCIA